MVNIGDLIEFGGKLFYYYQSKRTEKIPINIFIRKIESKFNVKLSQEDKNELIEEFCSQENTRVIRDKYGRKFILVGSLY
ncbi:MAG: hypothetical protein ABIH49_00065 [archaeon]